ncbi:MAG TPA: uracil-DNA glycosylase family protein [Polyangiaceae bacterium]|nr:uracil-DNA glycosylase family protein [Polyangiaceae bacterium]
MAGEHAPASLRDEVVELVAAVRDYVLRHEAAGTTGFPRASSRPAVTGVEPPSAPAVATLPPPAHAAGAEREAVRAPVAPPVAARVPGGARAVDAGVARGSPASRARLAELEREVAACERCGLHRGRQRTVFARGTGASGLCFVGEGPGAEEDAQGLPFVGAAGQLLDRMIEGMGLSREEVYVCNIVKCRPPDNRKPLPEEMAACQRFLEEQLELVDPEVMVALGATAVQGLFGTTAGITRLRGTWRLYRGKIAVMPTFHPAYLLRTPSAKRDVWNDLKEVLRHLGREVPGRSQ